MYKKRKNLINEEKLNFIEKKLNELENLIKIQNT